MRSAFLSWCVSFFVMLNDLEWKEGFFCRCGGMDSMVMLGGRGGRGEERRVTSRARVDPAGCS